MALKTLKELVALVQDELMPAYMLELEKLECIDRWYRWSPDDIILPPKATAELKALRELSRVPWLGLVVTSTAQCMYVDGYRSSLDPAGNAKGNDKPSTPWKIWQANGWRQRQNAVHRAMLAYGYAYATCVMGEDFKGDEIPVLRGVSPRKMWAVYDDPAEDDWPRVAMRILRKNDQGCRIKIYDDEAIYTLVERKENGITPENAWTLEGDPELHRAGVTPVVRYCNQLDLDGRTPGEIEPHIPIAGRINKTSYDRMLTQHFNSWKVRTVTGMVEPDTDDDAVRAKLKLRQDDLLIAEDPDTKFGTLDETQLNGFIAAHEADVESLAAVTQTPTHELTGKLINVSAEGLAMIRASQQQKVYERQLAAGAGHVQLLRLASYLAGDEEHADDVAARVTWQDTSIRSMAQAVDALGKACQMLNIPATALWGRIPGVEKDDVEEWIELAERDDPINRMAQQLDRQAAPDPSAPDPSAPPQANAA